MRPDRISELLKPFLSSQLVAPQAGRLDIVERISTYIDLLLRWNAHINLTAIRDPEQIVTRHFGESLFGARHLFPAGAELASTERPTVADIGSGAGFPGLPMKLWAPHIALTLVESNHKKVAFLREVVRALSLTEVNVRSERAQEIADSFAVVTLRAVERFEDVLPIAARLTQPGGRMALLLGSTQVPVATSTLRGFRWSPAEPIPGSRSRVLAIGQREGA